MQALAFIYMKIVNPLQTAILPSGATLIRVLCLLSMTCTLQAWSQYSLDSFGIGPSGDSAGGAYSLTATIETESAAAVTGGTYSLETGFWAITAVPTPGAPSLTIQNTETNTVIVSWQASSQGFELHQNSNLNTPNWTIAPQAVNISGDNKFIVVNPPSGNLFYRLTKANPGSPFQVVNLNDNGAGSLRAAIQSATNNSIVTFAAGLEGMIVLNSELAINKNLTIAGPGATVIAVSGENTNRVFNISSGNVKISGLTIRDGVARTSTSGANAKGGGVFNSATLVLSDCALVANLAVGGTGASGINANGGVGGSGLGGGIYNTGTLAVVNCTLALNEARGNSGGIGADGTGNGGFAGGNGGGGLGGAICNDGTLSMTNCTLALNRVTGGNGGNGGEGGLFKGRGGNGGAAEGAGILNRQMSQVANLTLTTGVAERGTGGTGVPNGTVGSALGGGFRTTTTTASLVNSLIAQNSLGTSITAANGLDVSGGVISHGYNLVGITNGSSGWMANDKVGNNAAPLNPLIAVLEDNGSWIPTMALLPGSPAIDQGKAIGVPTDQRGFPRRLDSPAIPNSVGGDGSDIGAFESNP